MLLSAWLKSFRSGHRRNRIQKKRRAKMVQTETFEDRVLLVAQVLTPSLATVAIPNGGQGSFDVLYSSDGNAEQTTGLSMRMHFDSSKVNFDTDDLSNIFESDLSGTDVQDDTTDFDNDPATDKFLNMLWFDIGGNWPGTANTQPLRLFTASFSATSAFDGSTIKFTGSPPANSTIDATATVQLTEAPPIPSLTISSATATEGGDLQFDVTVSGDSEDGTPVTVDFATSTGTASSADFTAVNRTLTFTAGGARTQTVVVATTNDTLPEASEQLTATLSNPANATIGTATATGTIEDDGDQATVSISGTPTVDEGGNLVFEVSLNVAPLSTLTVDFATVNGTAVAGSDFTANSGTLSFTNAATQTITVASVNDDVAEDAESFTVALSNVTGGAIGTASATGSITDNDGNGTISGVKFHDRNLNGTQDNNEEGLSGWVITLTDTDDGSTVATATTGSGGAYSFTEVRPGNYSVTETIQDGFVQSAPASAVAQAAFDLDQDNNLFFSGNDFEDWGGLGEKWMQGDGGWYYITPDGSFFQWNGSPRNQLSGNFVERLSSTYHADTSLLYEAEAASGHNFELASNEVRADVDFGNYQLGSISGLKFFDEDASGSRDAGEGGLENWTIQLLDTGGNVLDSTTTAANGTYSFDDLTPGDYLVREVQQEGFVQTYPVVDGSTIVAETAFSLDRERGFFATPNDFFNWGGRNEKWFQGIDGYHFVTPNGNIFEWDGSSRDALTGILVGDLTSEYYDDPTLITDAQFPGGSAVTLESGGSISQNFGNAESGPNISNILGAGNVEVRVSDGDLIIEGDDEANAVAVFQNQDGAIVVVGAGTTINGVDEEFIAFETADSIPDDLRVNMNGGANIFIAQDLSINDDFRFRSNGENDFLLAENVNVNGDLNVDTDSGDDIVGLNEVLVAGRSDFSLDGGNDVLGVVASHHQGNVRVKARGGDDMVITDGSRFGAGAALDMSSGNDTVAAIGSYVAGKANLHGGSGDDAGSLQDTTSAEEVDVSSFEADTIDDLNGMIDAVLARLAERGVDFDFDSGNVVTE